MIDYPPYAEAIRPVLIALALSGYAAIRVARLVVDLWYEDALQQNREALTRLLAIYDRPPRPGSLEAWLAKHAGHTITNGRGYHADTGHTYALKACGECNVVYVHARLALVTVIGELEDRGRA